MQENNGIGTGSSARAWGLLTALTLLNVLNLGDRYLLISFSTSIIPELGLTNFQFGLLTGFVFTGVYTLFGLFAGSLADRVNRPKLIAAGLGLWSLLTAATGLAKNFGHLAAARLLIGVGEACLTPAALSMLADRFPATRRALASGVYYLGLPIGIGGSFLFAAAVEPIIGWRGGFILLGGIGVVAALLVAWLMRDPARGGAVADRLQETKSGSFKESFVAMRDELRHNRVFTLTLFGSTFIIFAQGAGVLDLVWWVGERGYDAAEAQTLLGVVFLVGGIMGAILGGIGGDWAHRRFTAGRLKFLGWAFLVSMPVVLAYRIVPGDTAMFYILALLVSMLALLLFGPVFTAIQESVPVQHRGSAVAVLLLFGAFAGASSGNATVGWLADYFAAAGYAEPITLAILATTSVGFLGIPLFFAAARSQAKSDSTRAGNTLAEAEAHE